MEIAVISDIHGNMEAVEAVMADIQKEKCEKLFVLGDFAMAGPEPRKTIQYFIEKDSSASLEMIQGNTDQMIAEYTQELYEKLQKKAPIMADALKDDAKILDFTEQIFLKSLPAQKEVEIEGVKFLLVHGSPRKNNEDILPETPMENVEKMIKKVDAQVILCGHTHIPCGFQTQSKKSVINVGSIGRPFTPEPKSCYLIINVENGRCIFEHKFVKYDNIKAANKLKKRNFWGADKLAETLINPKERHF
jgi:putative phosphoesterase